jgi:hypothetical protein
MGKVRRLQMDKHGLDAGDNEGKREIKIKK